MNFYPSRQPKPHSWIYWAIFFIVFSFFALISIILTLQLLPDCDLTSFRGARRIGGMFFSAMLCNLFAAESLGKACRIRRADACFYAMNPEPTEETLSSLLEHPKWTQKRDESRLAAQEQNAAKSTRITLVLVILSIAVEAVFIVAIGLRGSTDNSLIGAAVVYLALDIACYCVIFKPWKR